MQADMRGEHPLQHCRDIEMTRNSLEDLKRSRRQLTKRLWICCITSSDLTRMPIKRDRVPASFTFNILCSPSTNRPKQQTSPDSRNLEACALQTDPPGDLDPQKLEDPRTIGRSLDFVR